MKLPENIDDLKLLIKNEVQENIHLDYKDSRAIDKNKRHEIAKDASAFANSDGGILIYGIREEEHLPIEIDQGVDHRIFTREWLEEVITSNITPIIDELKIIQIPLSETNSAFAIQIPKSYRAPHQDQSSKRYFKRYNFKSQPMENYEINDVRSRTYSVSPLVNFDVSLKHRVIVYFVVSNIGNVPAENVNFSFSIELPWRDENRKPPLLTKGIKYLPPGREFKWFFRTAQDIFSKDKKIPTEFEVTATYFHPQIGRYYSDVFYIDFNDYLHTEISESEIFQHGKKLEESIMSLTGELKSINKHLEAISNIAGPTGLDFSITSLKDIKSILSGESSFVKIDPVSCDHTVFREVLEIDYNLAFKIEQHFWQHKSFEGIENIEGFSQEILDRFWSHFWNDFWNDFRTVANKDNSADAKSNATDSVVMPKNEQIA